MIGVRNRSLSDRSTDLAEWKCQSGLTLHYRRQALSGVDTWDEVWDSNDIVVSVYWWV